ncbi:hypothetical protein LOZ12_002359 [Ophidiomyces ophidiicola]|uniref:Uncharacterized protein n=1 Tax=Ophidiomyces ophidiicola TaxID=1387563 RepID=A0ACB8UXG8_9EURO|nr:hypothetical protein LOZ62_003759 [Ophidiomyces ophidiicola]KAI1972305.1 hypothetical protein LOZ56_002522 [Ophidiomyces ophidiicola]KAI2032972.1 hypothetical protein LOZ48_002228 [Ophidiomyces ophidiicola]KAI2038430.1 hypothetical protein LOZ47_003203 [Ophidiomyces ophidiicola]KAI2051587.1 hypothetical protein LOZ38_002649 [Ophidiomyces ophidiicola]
MPQVEFDSFLSDESSFYGDEEEIADLEDRATTFDPLHYWRTLHATYPAVVAASLQLADGNGKDSDLTHRPEILGTKLELRHAHDGREECRQPTESVTAFLQRLPPSTAKIGPWLFIGNRAFHAPVPQRIHAFQEKGLELLGEFEEQLLEIQPKDASKSSAGKAALTRKINIKRRKVEDSILQAARDNNITTGKWMLFRSVDKVDDAWKAVASATAQGLLGIEAKVSTDPEGSSPQSRLICIYTKDFREKEDIRRVLLKLVDLGLVSTGRGPATKPIYYKCDAYTHLDIMGGNKWGIKPGMYSSTDALAEKW